MLLGCLLDGSLLLLGCGFLSWSCGRLGLGLCMAFFGVLAI